MLENKERHVKVLLNSFHSIHHTLGFCPQTKKLEPTVTDRKTLLDGFLDKL